MTSCYDPNPAITEAASEMFSDGELLDYTLTVGVIK